jgi:primosomal protein N' (replication factor Y) (superfamily II helicase)
VLPTIAEVLLPVPLAASQSARFSYRLLHTSQYAHEPALGKRALVGFGRGKQLAGVIVALHHEEPTGLEPRRLRIVEQILDAEPVITAPQLQLFAWLADYYLCGEGEVLKAALPTGLKLQSELIIRPHPELLEPPKSLPDAHYQLLEALSVRGQLSISEAAQVLGVAQPRPVLRRLAARGLLLLDQQLEASYRPKTIRGLRLAPVLSQPEARAEAFASLSRAPAQEALLLLVSEASRTGEPIAERELLARTGASAGAARALITRGYLEATEIEVSRLSDARTDRRELDPLTEPQTRAWGELTEAMAESPLRPILLHGATGSGKTELYIRLLQQTLAEGRQALYLLPEIGLTPQIIQRIQAALGEQVGVYHSRFSAAQRVEIWNHLLSGHYRAVIGVRSALLLPFDDLGLVIVDEEHDASFKQNDPAPRYHARDAAVWLAHQLHIPVVLGSATPSLESYANAQAGKYALVSLPERALATQPPSIELIDLKKFTRAQLSFGQLSEPLIAALRTTLERGEQSIVFKNRRGFAPLLVCEHCGHVPRCLYCDVSMTYHKRQHILRCHLCGYTDEQPDTCPNCGHPELRPEGIGTERLEEHLAELLPKARIARMDLDTTRGREAMTTLLGKMARHEIDILVGTQMVTKGLDFARVTLAAVVQADATLTWPDFRAVETSYQLLTQLAGRAGRRAGPGQSPGRLVIQTRLPTHPLFAQLERPYAEFFDAELTQRRENSYPPLVRLVRLEVRHRDAPVVERAAADLGQRLRARWGAAILGPEFTMVARVRGLYRMQLMIKWRQAVSRANRAELRSLTADWQRAHPSAVQLTLDVDPR